MYEQVVVFAGLALLALLCLPFTWVHKLVLELYAWCLRLALLALLGAAAYLWFFPDRLPVQVTDMLNELPGLKAVLPEPGTRHFGACAAALLVAVLLPLLAALDVSRKLAGRRLKRLLILTRAPQPAAEPVPSVVSPGQAPSPAPRRVDRRAAADAMAAAAGVRRTQPTANRLD